MAFHQRSTSLPSRPHVSETEVKQELHSLEASISSSNSISTMCDGLRTLANIYDDLEEIICLPSNHVFSSQQRRMLDGEMEGSLDLLDLCSAMQEIFVDMQAIIQELQVALRKGDDSSAQAKIQAYTRLVKKAKNHFKKNTKKAPADCSMVMLLAKAREISVSLLESTVRLLSKQIEMPKQSLVSKAFHIKKEVVQWVAESLKLKKWGEHAQPPWILCGGSCFHGLNMPAPDIKALTCDSQECPPRKTPY